MNNKQHSSKEQHKRIVIKVGTNLLTTKQRQFDSKKIKLISNQIIKLKQLNKEIVLVSYGAITLGKGKIKYKDTITSIEIKQATAAIGQSFLITEWNNAFKESGIITAQALLTRLDLTNQISSVNVRNTLLKLLELNTVPIINENDVVSTEEIESSTIGDNDNLSAFVAKLIDADLLIILTDQDGLFDKNPTHVKNAKLIKKITKIDQQIKNFAQGSSSINGTGGMITKVEAAEIATNNGIDVIIANGNIPNIIDKVLSNAPIGTHFLAKKI